MTPKVVQNRENDPQGARDTSPHPTAPDVCNSSAVLSAVALAKVEAPAKADTPLQTFIGEVLAENFGSGKIATLDEAKIKLFLLKYFCESDNSNVPSLQFKDISEKETLVTIICSKALWPRVTESYRGEDRTVGAAIAQAEREINAVIAGFVNNPENIALQNETDRLISTIRAVGGPVYKAENAIPAYDNRYTGAILFKEDIACIESSLPGIGYDNSTKPFEEADANMRERLTMLVTEIFSENIAAGRIKELDERTLNVFLQHSWVYHLCLDYHEYWQGVEHAKRDDPHPTFRIQNEARQALAEQIRETLFTDVILNQNYHLRTERMKTPTDHDAISAGVDEITQNLTKLRDFARRLATAEHKSASAAHDWNNNLDPRQHKGEIRQTYTDPIRVGILTGWRFDQDQVDDLSLSDVPHFTYKWLGNFLSAGEHEKWQKFAAEASDLKIKNFSVQADDLGCAILEIAEIYRRGVSAFAGATADRLHTPGEAAEAGDSFIGLREYSNPMLQKFVGELRDAYEKNEFARLSHLLANQDPLLQKMFPLGIEIAMSTEKIDDNESLQKMFMSRAETTLDASEKLLTYTEKTGEGAQVFAIIILSGGTAAPVAVGRYALVRQAGAQLLYTAPRAGGAAAAFWAADTTVYGGAEALNSSLGNKTAEQAWGDFKTKTYNDAISKSKWAAGSTFARIAGVTVEPVTERVGIQLFNGGRIVRGSGATATMKNIANPVLDRMVNPALEIGTVATADLYGFIFGMNLVREVENDWSTAVKLPPVPVIDAGTLATKETFVDFPLLISSIPGMVKKALLPGLETKWTTIRLENGHFIETKRKDRNPAVVDVEVASAVEELRNFLFPRLFLKIGDKEFELRLDDSNTHAKLCDDVLYVYSDNEDKPYMAVMNRKSPIDFKFKNKDIPDDGTELPDARIAVADFFPKEPPHTFSVSDVLSTAYKGIDRFFKNIRLGKELKKQRH